jgi:CyaY protein
MTELNEPRFNQLAEATLAAIEAAVEALQDEIDDDFEMAGGILTLTLENSSGASSKIIINRQIATREIWVAARSGGYHCGRQNDDWVCNTTRETLAALLSRVLSEQSGTAVDITL